MTSSPRRAAARHAVATVLVLATALFAAGCGGSDDGGGGAAAATPEATSQQPVTITGGTSTLELDTAVDGILSAGGVSTGASGAAQKGEGGYAFPIQRGELGVTSVSGRVGHGGGLRFQTSGRKVVVRDLIIDLDERVVSGTVGKRQIPVMQLAPDSGQVERAGGTVTVSGLQASLTKEAAGLINGRSKVEGPLGTDLIKEGQGIGQITIDGQPQ